MRYVDFYLFDATADDAAACLEAAGFAHTAGTQWIYPPGDECALYAWCSPYEAVREPPEEHLDTLQLTGGRVPGVVIEVGISGRVFGDDEIRYAAERILSRFDGVALDDYVDHGWTLAEIRDGDTVEGRPFFDDNGYGSSL